MSASVEDAFNVVTDAGSFASWNPTIRASRQLDDGPVGNGTRFEWDLRGFGKVTQELREFDRIRQVRIVPQRNRSKAVIAFASANKVSRHASITNWR
jgi:hypothetical protein